MVLVPHRICISLDILPERRILLSYVCEHLSTLYQLFTPLFVPSALTQLAPPVVLGIVIALVNCQQIY